ncbi:MULTISPECIES: helix-turn-helix domain-containing protein [unclassified Micromonospora]|uniref:helix-turn-helix domain-containing protein n=1 Tax=unclassified Micromonospora TaxID=2617518 RepID=UPI003A83AE8E
MVASALKEETYLPQRNEQLAQVHDFLRAHEQAGRGSALPRYFLVGATPGDRVELPAEIYAALRQVVDALQQGFAVTVAPQTLTLTTQQTADLLGISRPTVIKLLDEGQIPFERVGTHRRIRLPHLLAYRERRRAEQYAALEATAVSIDDEEDLDSVITRLRAARRAVARRRTGPSE